MCNLLFLVNLDLATLSLAGNAARLTADSLRHAVLCCVKKELLSTKRNICDCCRNIGHFLCGRKDN